MDSMPPGLADKGRGGGGLSNGASFRRSMTSRGSEGVTGTPASPTADSRITIVVVQKDDNGYGMKVSGDNPVFVESVKEGGAASRAGLHCGDIIIKVNGVNVTHSKHTEVVSLIKASTNVELTVQQQRSQRHSTLALSPPSRHHCSTPRSSERVTSPQPVDMDKKRQLESQRVHTFRLMLEKEQRYVDALRSELAKVIDQPDQEKKISKELQAAERRLKTLTDSLAAATNHQFTYALSQPSSPVNPFHIHTIVEGESADSPPPLPMRNPSCPSLSSHRASLPPLPPRPTPVPSSNHGAHSLDSGWGDPPADKGSGGGALVLGHHRTKSNPDPVNSGSQPFVEEPRRLVGAESMQDLYRRPKQGSYEGDSPHDSPAGTPPPPYRPLSGDSGVAEEVQSRLLSSDSMDSSHRSSTGPNIMSMEEDDTSDTEMSHLDDHGPFKSLTKLWEHHAHLAVFLNYVLSNSDPSSLLFYLVTDLYKEGNAKEMKRWAYEIHSSFLVPDGPLHLNNIDENLALEIDDVLLNDPDREEIMRKVFRKARLKAKEELNELLLDFQQKRIAGLGTLYGPADAQLEEALHDKNKEMKICESILTPKLEPFISDIERDKEDHRKFTIAAALATIMAKLFGLRNASCSTLLERCPTFVSKDKTLKTKLLIGKSKRISIRGHNFVAHQYYTVTSCNHCHLIIWGIGPQGYKCTYCTFDVHRQCCVRNVEETCPGPITKKDRGDNRISKLMEKIQARREGPKKHGALNITQADKAKKRDEEGEDVTENDALTGDRPVIPRRPDTVSEERPQHDEPQHLEDRLQGDITHHSGKAKNSPINRSESYRERIPPKKVREKRKTSDPNLSKTNDVDLDNQQGLSYNTNSGSSSNSSLSTRSLDSPCGPIEMVTASSGSVLPAVLPSTDIPFDSDLEADPDPPDWAGSVPDSVLNNMTGRERKRQGIINELFHTERTHVRNLKVLLHVFMKPMTNNAVLPSDQITLLFQNLDDMLDIHSRWNKQMKSRRREGPVVGNVGDLLLDMFDGSDGELFAQAAATFCAKQSIALAQLKELRSKITKLSNFLSEAEGDPLCRRFQLKDMLPLVMQRLTKYPLLFENLVKYSERGSEEERQVQRAVDLSKAILTRVNTSVNEAEAAHRLEEIQKRLDKSAFDKSDHPIVQEYRNLDLRKKRLLYESPLYWRVAGRKFVDVHALLLDDCIMLLLKQDDKFVLKFHSIQQSGNVFSPILKLSCTLARQNAVDKTALFIFYTANQAVMYEFAAASVGERDLWLRHISDAADAYKNRNGRVVRPEPGLSSQVPTIEAENPDDSIEKTKERDGSVERGKSDELDTSDSAESGASLDSSTTSNTQTSTLTPGADASEHHGRKSADTSPTQRRVADPLRLTTVENQLINPSEIVVSHKPILTAHPVFTPLEQLRHQDTAIRRALLEKQQLVADILHVPREDFLTIAELAGEPGGEKEAAELVLAAISQANQLTGALNEALRVTEEDTVSATSEVTTGCSPRGRRRVRLPGLPAPRVQGIANALNSQLTSLLEIVKEREEERERLRRELQRSREQIHALHEAQRKQSTSCLSCGRSDHVLDSGPAEGSAPLQPADSNVKGDENEVELNASDVIYEDDATDAVDENSDQVTADDTMQTVNQVSDAPSSDDKTDKDPEGSVDDAGGSILEEAVQHSSSEDKAASVIQDTATDG